MNDNPAYLSTTENSRLADKRHRQASWKNIFRHPWVYRIVRFVLGSIFLWSGITKLHDPESFATIIQAYGILPDGLILPAATALAGLEGIAAIGLLLDIRGSLATVTGLLGLFIIILSYGIWMGLDVDCGCFGPEDPEAKAFHGLRTALHRDGILVMGVVYLYVCRYVRAVRPIRINFFKSCIKSG